LGGCPPDWAVAVAIWSLSLAIEAVMLLTSETVPLSCELMLPCSASSCEAAWLTDAASPRACDSTCWRLLCDAGSLASVCQALKKDVMPAEMPFEVPLRRLSTWVATSRNEVCWPSTPFPDRSCATENWS
jgi:hypothetical protein